MNKNLSRRMFLKISSALAAAGIFAWKPDTEIVDASPVIGVDQADTGGGGTCDFDHEQPFSPYYLDDDCPICQAIRIDYDSASPVLDEVPATSVFVRWEDMEDGDTWGMPND